MAIFSLAEKVEQSISRGQSGVAVVAAEVVCCYTGKHSQALASIQLQTRNACGQFLLCHEPQLEVVEESLVRWDVREEHLPQHKLKQLRCQRSPRWTASTLCEACCGWYAYSDSGYTRPAKGMATRPRCLHSVQSLQC